MDKKPILLGVNIDHVATIRQARGTRLSRFDTSRPNCGTEWGGQHYRASSGKTVGISKIGTYNC